MLNPYKFHSQPRQLMGYAESSTKVPSIAWDMAKTEAQKRKLEHLWATDAELAYRYTRDVIGGRWPPGEAAIAKDPNWAYLYALYVIGGRWPPGEEAIAKDPESAATYQRQFGVKL